MAAKRIDTQGKAGHIITPAQPLEHFNITAPASEGAIQKFEQLFGLVLPEDYVTFLKKSNGGEGFVGDNAYLILWPVEQLLELNNAYQVQEYAPGLLLFGSDGGGEAFAFDTRLPEFPVVSVPFVGMDHSLARPIATSFNRFLEALYEGLVKVGTETITVRGNIVDGVVNIGTAFKP